jgi:RHS repeat-associated protein
MKKKLPTLLLIGFSLSVQAGHHYTLSGELSSVQDHHYTANSHILLSNGFKAEPKDGHEVLLSIDPYGVFPPEEGLTGGPFPSQDGVVGALPGTVGVGLLGGATYTIPIELPEGLGKMKPPMAIGYNSQGRNGLLGWGWDLVGLSAITRSGSNRYYDGYNRPVNYADDRYYLDGQRLLQVDEGTYGAEGVGYRTEEDRMSKIVSHGATGIQGTASFQVFTATGNRLSYGSSEDSRVLINGQHQVGVWLLKQITDRYGNEVTYHYQQNGEDYWLERICYSGNSGQEIPPAFTVVFSYTDRTDASVSFVGNCPHQRQQLLERITILNNGKERYRYQFHYQAPQPQAGYPYTLLKEIGFSAGDQHYNPTILQRGANNYPIGSSADVRLNVTTHGLENAFINAVKFSGDFNGDGYSDVLSLQPDEDGGYNTAELFLNKGVNGTLVFDHHRTFPLDQKISWINIADLDGDGLDDLIMGNRTRNPFPLPDVIDTDVYLGYLNAQGQLCFKHHHLPICTIPSNMVEAMATGDFLGEGKASILMQSTHNENTLYEYGLLYTYDRTADAFVMESFANDLYCNRFYPADYNGDGITEVLYQDEEGDTHIRQLRRDANGFLGFHTLSQGHPADWDDCFPGDFNGDGLTDLLLFESGRSLPWKVCLCDPTGFSSVSVRLPASFPYLTPGNYAFSLDQPHHTSHYLKVGDFDGNGCADIGLFHDNRFHAYYGPLQATTGTAQFAYTQQVSTSLFNLYDNMGICLGNFLAQEGVSFLGHNTLSFLPPLSLRQEVRCLIDGLGRKTEFDYGYLCANPNQASEDDFYQIRSELTDADHGLFVTSLPLRALQSVTTYNMNNRPLTVQCRYEGALLHKHGKGFLGFSKTRQDDYVNQQRQKTTVRSYFIEPNDHFIHLALNEETVYDGQGRTMARSRYSNRYYHHLKNDKVFIQLADKTAEEYDMDHPEQLLKKVIQATTVDPHCQPLFMYDDILSVTEVIQGTTAQPQVAAASNCEFQTRVTTDYMPLLPEAWLVNRPSTVTHRFRQMDSEDLVREERYQYQADKPFQLQSLTETPFQGDQPDLRLTRTTNYSYDAVGNLLSQTVSTPFDDEAPRTQRFEYGDTYGHLLLTRYTNAAGQETTYQYDPVYLYCNSMQDCNGLETRFEQDALGVTQTTRHPDGTLQCKAIRWSGARYSIWEKKTGQASKRTDLYPTGMPYREACYDINGNDLLSGIEYDDLGRVSKSVLPHAPTASCPSIEYTYLAPDRVSQILHPDGTLETIAYHGNETSTTRHTVDGSSQTESKTTNVMGWTLRSTDANGVSVLYGYEPDGKPKWAQIEGHDETRIEMAYDGWGNRISLYDPNYGLTTSQYNAFGECIGQTSPKLDQTTYRYDRLGNRVERIETENNGGTSRRTVWHYSQEPGHLGLLEDIETESQSIHYQYDAFNRLQEETQQQLGRTYSTRYAYDPASRVSCITHPSGYLTHYRYTSEGAMQTVLDASMQPLWHLNETNALQQPLKTTMGHGLVTQYEYDEKNQKLNALFTHHEGQCLQEAHYTYDGFSNLTSRSDGIDQHTEKFSYDTLNRLTGATDVKGTSTFEYDALGRLLAKTDHGEPCFSNADYSGLKPHALKSAEATEGVFPQERMDLQYTLFDKVSSITTGDRQVTFDYGYDHQRIGSTETRGGKTRQKVYTPSCEFITETGRPLVTRTFLSGPLGVFAVAETINGTTKLHYIHKDHLGSWTLVTDPDGGIEYAHRFDAWGSSPSDDLPFDRGFTGHEHIRGTGLINMNGRLYDPTTSSMLSPDNYIQLPDFSQNLNRYAYCLNNPLSFTDPDGNTFLENALLFYLFYCTDFGYEMQKHALPVAFHLDLHASREQLGIGADVSLGVPKKYNVSYRVNMGATYYWRLYDNSYQGWEFRFGSEWCLIGFIGFAGNHYHSGALSQTTNAIIMGNWLCNLTYENDHMFNIGKWVPGVMAADNGDRYRSAAARMMIGPVTFGVSLFTGDPGYRHEDRRTYADPEADNRKTYTINALGDDPDRYRAGIAYVGIGPIRFGVNSEQVRHVFQNRFAHDFLCRGDSPYFKVLDRPRQWYFYFGTGTGGSLW